MCKPTFQNLKEDFLHYLWKFQKFDSSAIKTSAGDSVIIVAPGIHNHNSGPDFFNGKISIGGQLWAGNIEIHINASDWYAHSHETDPAYENVILHVVWKNDAEIFRKDNSAIPTIELKKYVSENLLHSYKKLFSANRKWIYCEADFAEVDEFVFENWLEKLFIERLEKKSNLILDELKKSNNHWEELLFRLLAKNFGLKVNGEAFYSLANSVDFSIIKKVVHKQQDLEALLFGQAGFLTENWEDGYAKQLLEIYNFQKVKFSLDNLAVIQPKYFRLRPPNFPTIRLSQLSVLYSEKGNLFSEIMAAKTISELYAIFNISASDYWKTHYNFGVVSKESKKNLTKSFIDLLIINTIIPLKFCYSKHIGNDETENIISLISEITSEENSIISKFNSIRPISKNALHSQALIQLKNEYCDKAKCMQCAIGNAILKV